jgi:hypothetical protein
VVDLLAPRGELFHHWREFFLHGAAQAAVGQLEQLAIGLPGFVAADAAAAQQFTVDTEFAELIDDHGDAPAFGVLQQVAQQRGLATAEKAGNDGGGDLAGLHGHGS